MDMDADLLSTLADASFTFWGMAAAGSKLLLYVSSVCAVGLMLFRLVLPVGDAKLDRSILNLVAWAVVVAALASILRVMVQAGRLMGDVVFMADWEIVLISLGGPLGTSTVVRLIGLGVLLAAVLVQPLRLPGTLVGAVMVAGSFALTGHATREPQWLLAGLITVHLLAISFWFGALYPLHQLVRAGNATAHAADLSHRFGVQAMVVVPALVLVGGWFAWTIMGGPQALVTTAYGQMLLIKLAIVASVLGVGALNKMRLVPALAQERPGAGVRLRQSLRWETVVFLLIFAATAILTTSFTVTT